MVRALPRRAEDTASNPGPGDNPLLKLKSRILFIFLKNVFIIRDIMLRFDTN